MLIDWFTVIAQIINFLILLFLLHRFLYKPILKTIDKRQDQMQARWDAAETEKAEAAAEAEHHRRAQQELNQQREQILAEARAQAEQTHRDELQQAREEVAQKRQEWQNALQKEQHSILADFQAQFGQQMLAIVRQMLQDLANVELEQQVVQAFQQKLQELDDDTRRAMADAFASHDYPVKVQTSIELPQSSQESLRQTLQDAKILNGQPVQFDVSPDLICGIRLYNEAYDLAWDAEDYLQELQQRIGQTLSNSTASSKNNQDKKQNNQQSPGETF